MHTDAAANKPLALSPGDFATYNGRVGQRGRRVRFVCHARNGHMVVESIGGAGKPVRITVAAANIGPLVPDLLD